MDVKRFEKILSRMEISMKDTYEHSERTAVLCYAIAKELKLPPEDLELSYFAGLLHEIGKIDFPEKITVRFGEKVVDLDVDSIYPYLTICIINSIEPNDELNKIILQHQENIDGSGYPNGIQGEDISLLSRILRISDFYDSHRAVGISHDDTTKLLRLNSEVIFPNKIITPFIKSVIKNELQLEY